MVNQVPASTAATQCRVITRDMTGKNVWDYTLLHGFCSTETGNYQNSGTSLRLFNALSMICLSIVPSFLCLFFFSLVCLFVFWLVCLFVCSFVCSFVRWFVCSYVCSFVCTFIRSFVCSCVRSCVRSFVRLFVCLFVRSFYRSFFARLFVCCIFIRSFTRFHVLASSLALSVVCFLFLYFFVCI